MSHYNDEYLAEELSKEDKEYLVQKLGAKAAKVMANEIDEEEAEEFRLKEQETKESAVFDLDAALDSYDPTFPRYTPSADAFEFFTLMRLVEGKDFDFSTPIAHYFMVDMLLGYIDDPMMFPYSEEVCKTIEIDNLAIGFMQSRGMAKSTVVISFFGVYSAIKGELPNGIGKVYFYLWLAASSKGGARINALAVRAMCEDSVYLKNYFESMRFTETESEFVRKGTGPTKNRSFLIRYQGINTGVRGSRYGERRPDCHVAGTTVMTEYGTHLVEDHQGPISRGHWEICSEIKVRGLTNTEIVSKDHQYWAKVCVGDRCVIENGKKLPRYSETKPKFTKVSELTDRHWIGERIDTEIQPVQPLQEKVPVITERNAQGHVIATEYNWQDIQIDEMQMEEFWWIYGLWLGDGSLQTTTLAIEFYIANTERETVGKKLYECADSIGMKLFEDKNVRPGCYKVVVTGYKNRSVAHWLKSQKAGNSIKMIPNWVLKIEPKLQKQLILGYIAADGYEDPVGNQVRINSVNYDVLRKLQKMCGRLGLPTYIRNTKQAGEQLFPGGKVHMCNHQWELKIKEGVSDILGFTQLKESHRVKYKQVHISDGMLWRQVQSIKDTEETHELIVIKCHNKKLTDVVGTEHAYETEYGVSKNCIGTDDAILNTAAAYSKVMTANLEDIIYSDSLAALKGGGKGRLINTFTPFHYNDVNTKAILNGTFTPVIIPIAADFDIDKPDLTARDIESSWEDMHPATSIAKMVRKAKASNKLKSFLQERMLRLASDADRLIPEKCIQFCDTTIIQDNLHAYNIYITTDFTTTKGENADFSGAAVWALGNNGDWFMLDLVLRKMDMEEQYRTVLDWAARYKRMGKHVELGVEIDGGQVAHIFSLEKIMMERSDWYTFAKQRGVDKDDTRKGILSRKAGGDKHERFRVAVTQFMLPQKLWLPEHLKDTKDMKEFLDQIRGATHANFARSDDACFTGDTLVHMADGSLKRIDQVQKGDMVITSAIDSAYSKCGAAIMTGVNEVNTYHMSDGSEISMTKNHPVYTTDGWVLAEDLLPEHKIVKGTKCNQQSESSDTNGQEKIQDTTNLLRKLTANVDGFINGLGKELMVNSQKGMTFTTKITTPIIMPSKIWNYLVQQSMQSIIKTNVGYYAQKKIERRIGYSWMLLEYLLTSGIVQTKDDNGIENTEKELKMLYLLKINNVPAIHAVRKLCHTLRRETCTVQISAPSKRVLKEIKQNIHTFVWYAEKSTDLTEIKVRLKRAAKSVEKSYQDKTHLENVLKNVKVAESYLQTVKVRDIALSAMQKKTKHLQVYPALSAEQYLIQVEAQLNTAQYNVELITLIEKGETREEKTYNLEVEDTSTYLVNSGVVVHNCDLVSMLNHMVVVQPTEIARVPKHSNIKRNIFSSMGFEEEDEVTRGSTIF